MPLTPPPNHENLYKLIALGVICVAIVFTLKSNNNLHTGDLQHSLPHGGTYKDGTKSVNYFKPSASHNTNHKWLAFSAIGIISLLIWITAKLTNRSSNLHPASCSHCSHNPTSLRS